MQTMTVAENLLLNNEPTYGFGIIRRKTMRDEAAQLLDQYEIGVDPDAVVGDLPNDLKKMVQIVKAVSLKPRILLLDEPTSSLTDAEVRVALRLIRRLAGEGVGIVLISHYLNEIFEVCDDLTVMRDGQVVAERSGQRNDACRRSWRPWSAAMSRPCGAPNPAVAAQEGDPADAGREPHRSRTATRESASRSALVRCWASPALPAPGLGELAKAIFGAAAKQGHRPGARRRDGPCHRAIRRSSLAAGIALLTGDRLREGILAGVHARGQHLPARAAPLRACSPACWTGRR